MDKWIEKEQLLNEKKQQDPKYHKGEDVEEPTEVVVKFASNMEWALFIFDIYGLIEYFLLVKQGFEYILVGHKL